MTPERYKQIGQLYHQALELEGDERAAFLERACAGDELLRREVESLIAAHEEQESFLSVPAVEVAARQMAAETPLSISQQIGHYRILSLLGKGGMGEVYLAQDTKLNRKVALKALPSQFTQDAERVRRFEREARAASALNHPNILAIHEIGQECGRHYIVTEFVDGETLRQRCERAKVTLSEALDITIQVAGALAAAHEAGVAHRDIKPENVMLRRDGYVKVLDFGLAKLLEKAPEGSPGADIKLSDTTMPGVVMGTAAYMSPEQARGLKVDARTDIFSLGIVLYEMVEGRTPFEGANMFEMVAAILDREPEPLTESPEELQRIVGKALRKDREERYQTAKELLVDLKDLRGEMAVAAKLESSGRAERKEPVTAQAKLIPASPVPASPTTSNAKVILGEIKRRKLGVFIALLSLVSAAAGMGLYLYPRKTRDPIDSIAVLPFTNQNRAEETEYLADGLTESIINNLTQLAELRVIARNSAFRYKGKEDDPLGAGQALGVRAVLVGRVMQHGENLIVSAELVDVRENKQLWGQQYNNRKLADVFAVQEELAKEISENLRLKLTNAEKQQLAKRPTENIKAFQYYMQGRGHVQRRTREDLFIGISYFEKAIVADHNYALAYAGLTEAYLALGARGYIAPNESRRQAEVAALKAVALDENLAEAHTALGLAYITAIPSNYLLGDRELRRAIELNPNLAMAYQYLGNTLWLQGRLNEGLEKMLKARELDPLSPIIARQMVIPYYFQRDYGQAIEVARQANELGPAFNTSEEIGVYLQNKLFNDALAELAKAKQNRRNDPLLLYSAGMVYAAQGKRAEALQIIKELEMMSGANLTQAQNIAKIYATLNEKKLALSWLERGLAAEAIGIFYKDDPVWDKIRNDARFGDLLRRMGIPQ